MSDTAQISQNDPRQAIVDIGRILQAEDVDLKAALKLIRPTLAALDAERAALHGDLEAAKAMRADSRGVIPIMPRTPAEAWDYARSLCEVGHVPSAYRKDGKKEGEPVLGLVALGLMKAMEVGLAPQTGLGNIMPVNDRFTVWGDGAQALVQSKGVIASHGKEHVGPDGFDPKLVPIGEWPETFGWRVWFKRVGQEGLYEETYVVANARRQRLWMNTMRKPWIESPERMLCNRARAFALRDGFADCLMGLGIREEIEDMLPAAEPKLVSTAFLDDDPQEAAA